MDPAITPDDMRYISDADSEFISQCLSEAGDMRPVSRPNGNHGFCCHYDIACLFTPGVALSSLIHHVFHIVSSCTEEQMSRIHAWWIVATMQYLKSLWNRAYRYLPAIAVRSNCADSETNRAISAIVCGTAPDPAGIRLDHSLPEPRLNRRLFALTAAIFATTCNFTGIGPKGVAATNAGDDKMPGHRETHPFSIKMKASLGHEPEGAFVILA